MGMNTGVTRALVSVYDKTGLIDFCSGLVAQGVEIVSSGGTARHLADADIPVILVEDVTNAPEMLGGRVKTLHPNIHGGILANLGDESHLADLEARGIAPFQLVVSNLYPFRATVADPDVSVAEAIEQIDIGGPTMVRAAAKNHAWVGIVTSPRQYEEVLAAIESGGLSDELRVRLAREAFFHTASYDAAIVNWMARDEELPQHVVTPLRLETVLRYGENPHQPGARYREEGLPSWWDDVTQHAGIALSYLNLFDAGAAWTLAHDLAKQSGQKAVAIIKHANPCGAAVGDDLADTYQRAYECDARSAFGGIAAFSHAVDAATLERIVVAAQADVVIAPGYEDGVVDGLVAKRKNTRLLEAPVPDREGFELRQIPGGWLGQVPHHFKSDPSEWTVVTDRQPTVSERQDASFAWRVAGHVTSNTIVLAKDGTAWGIGAGQQNRVEAGEIAAGKAAGRADGGACASDAFYPFPDGIEAAAAAGATVVVQPGGALRDDEVIARANELGLAMLFTGERHFLH